MYYVYLRPPKQSKYKKRSAPQGRSVELSRKLADYGNALEYLNMSRMLSKINYDLAMQN